MAHGMVGIDEAAGAGVGVGPCVLRPPRMEDCWALYEGVRTLGGGGLPQVQSVDGARQLLVELTAAPRSYQVVLWIVTDASDAYRGHVILDRNAPPNHGHASIGLWIDQAWQRRGFGTCALGLALREIAVRDRFVRRVDGICRPDHVVMRRVFAACGFRAVAVLPAQHLFGGRYVDMELWQYLYRDGAGVDPV